jgi:hypothetical protein
VLDLSGESCDAILGGNAARLLSLA